MTGNARAVTVALTKGGVGKTATAINTADRLETNHGRTLLADVDPAGNATEGVGLADRYADDDVPHLGGYLKRAIDADDEDVRPSLDECIVEREGTVDVLPSHTELASAERVVDTKSRFAVLSVEEHVIEPLLGDAYDYIVFDTAGDADSLFREAAILGSENVIVPMEPGEESLRGLETLMSGEIVPARTKLNRTVNLLAIVPNKTLSDNESKRLVEGVAENFTDAMPSFADPALFEDPQATDPGIRKRVQFTRAWREGVPLAEYDPENDMIPRLDELAAIVARGGVDE